MAKEKHYLVSSATTRLLFIFSAIGMLATIIAILVLASIRPQGKFVDLDSSLHAQLVETATEQLNNYHENEDGTVAVPIGIAMGIVAERGFDEVLANAKLGSSPISSTANATTVSGEDVYSANCASCHQATGLGIPGAFPPLAGSSVNLEKLNRDYLPSAVLFGLMGEIDVNGQTFNGAMPAWKHLSDSDISAVTNYIVSAWDNPTEFQAYSSDEIANIRRKDLSFNDVLELRSQTGNTSTTPVDNSSTATVAQASTTATETAAISTAIEAETEALSTATETATPTAEAELITTETETTTPELAVASFEWQSIGETAYANCVACHQATGNGISGAFPGLNKNAANLYNSNRDYLALAVISGVMGAIEVDGQTYNGAMPAWAHLSDEQIAAVLNYSLSSWDNLGIVKDFKIYTPSQIAEYRSLGLSAEEVHSLRP